MRANGPQITDTHIIAGLALCYLAMVAEFGFKIALMESGLLAPRVSFAQRGW
jgi:hypothetical protein